MPTKSVLEDPTSFNEHLSTLPDDVAPRQVILKNGKVATLVPFRGPHSVPAALMNVVCAAMNQEIEDGDTYPMTDRMAPEIFANYWFGNFGAVMLLGNAKEVGEILHASTSEQIFERLVCGTFYVKPNYPGRCSHVCNGGFLVTPGHRNCGVGKLMGESYVEWAGALNYSYSVFNLVFRTNPASMRIWESLGFERIGLVKGCGKLRSFPGQVIDAIQYGRDLGPKVEERKITA